MNENLDKTESLSPLEHSLYIKKHAFAKGLKAYIDRKGWTIKHVARKTGAPEHTLYAWTSGNRVPALYIQEWLFKIMDGIE